jgi:hypothetical protein
MGSAIVCRNNIICTVHYNDDIVWFANIKNQHVNINSKNFTALLHDVLVPFWCGYGGMCVSVTADTTATAHNNDRYDHQQTKYANTQPQGQPEQQSQVIIFLFTAARACSEVRTASVPGVAIIVFFILIFALLCSAGCKREPHTQCGVQSMAGMMIRLV